MTDVLGGKRTAVEVEAAQPDSLKRHIASKWLLQNNPHLTDASIARLTGYPAESVGRHRKELEEQGRIAEVIQRVNLVEDTKVFGPRQALPTVEVIESGKFDLAVTEAFSTALVAGSAPNGYSNPAASMLAKKQQSRARNTVKAYEVYANKWARLMGAQDLSDAPWHGVTKAEHVLMLMEALRRDSDVTVNSYPGYYAALLEILKDSYLQGNIEPLEWERIQSIDRPTVDESQIQQNPPMEWAQWLKVHQAFRFYDEADWMLSAALCLAYPNGLRPSDCLGITRADLSTLEDGYIEFRRRKTKKRYGLMLDHLPGVRAVLKKWNETIPDGIEHLWFERRGGLQWGNPITPESTSNVLRAGMARHMKKALGNDRAVPQQGRVSYKTHATGHVSDLFVNINGGWKASGQGASVKYFRQHHEAMKGAFAAVPDFYQFDQGLLEHITPYLTDEARLEAWANAPEPPRLCRCGCGEVIDRNADVRKQFIDAAHKMRFHRANGT